MGFFKITHSSDLYFELWDMGQDLFRDSETLRARFVAMDIFDSKTTALEGIKW